LNLTGKGFDEISAASWRTLASNPSASSPVPQNVKAHRMAIFFLLVRTRGDDLAVGSCTFSFVLTCSQLYTSFFGRSVALTLEWESEFALSVYSEPEHLLQGAGRHLVDRC
jgi:hypothetical protein